MPGQIRDGTALEEALASELFLLFKHSFRCSISAHAFKAYEQFAQAHPDVPTGWIDVVEDRPLSLAAAETTGVTHKSPQALLVRGGTVRWHASHFDIKAAALEAAL